MKIINKYIFLLFAIVVFGCDPIENRDKLGGVVPKSDLKYSVTQKSGHDNTIYLASKTPGVIPFWEYGSNTSIKVNDTINFPFAGNYTVKYTAFAAGGTTTDSTQVKVSQNDPEYFKDPIWKQLSNDALGKTWTLDMEAPMGFFGTTYPNAPDGWDWQPKLKEQTWIMDNRYYGDMTFDLNGGMNYSKTSVDANGNATTCKGSFTLDIAKKEMLLENCDLLFGGNYYNCATNWRKVKVIKVSENELILGILRDKCEGQAYYGFRYKVKA